MDQAHASLMRPAWQRVLWLTAGTLALAAGVVGIFLPLLPTTPLVLLAAWCFSRGSRRWEAWLLGHPRFGPMVRDWRRHRAIPLRAKQMAFVMMAVSSAIAWWAMPASLGWLPAAICAAVAAWMWRLPTPEEARLREFAHRAQAASGTPASRDGP